MFKASSISVYAVGLQTVKCLLGTVLVKGKLSGQRQAKVRIDVVLIKGKIYKHELEKAAVEEADDTGRRFIVCCGRICVSSLYREKETFGAQWKMETDGKKNKAWESERYDWSILKQLIDFSPRFVSVVERIIILKSARSSPPPVK